MLNRPKELQVNAQIQKPLNPKQTEIMLILYKFRFATRDLIVKYQKSTSSSYTHYRLKLLQEKGYIGRHYDGQYKIHGKHAIYYLQPKGIRVLKTNPDLSVKALNGMYKDGTVSQQFMERSLTIFQHFIKLNELYGNTLSFYTKNEITSYGYFPRPLPDAYLTLKSRRQGTTQYLLELIETLTPFYMVRRRLLRYISHFDSGDWDESGTEYPAILLICEDSRLERRVQRLVTRLLDQADIDELKIYTTTTRALLGSNLGSEIWTDIDSPEKLSSLPI